MLDRLIRMKNAILILSIAIFLALWTTALVLGEGENKVMFLVLSWVFPAVVYGFARLMYKIVGINASFKQMRAFFWFFLFGGTIGTIAIIASYIAEFPNGLTPTLGVGAGLIIATLDNAKKNAETEKNKKENSHELFKR